MADTSPKKPGKAAPKAKPAAKGKPAPPSRPKPKSKLKAKPEPKPKVKAGPKVGAKPDAKIGAKPPPAPTRKPGRQPGGKSAAKRGAEQRERMAARGREQTVKISEVGEIPPVADPERRESCRLDLHKFLTTYFPASTGLSPFSADHDRVIKRIQGCILDGGRLVNAVFRGFSKTTISENSAVWAVLYGHRRFVAIFGSDSGAAAGNVDSIQTELSDNDLLLADFPEVCHPIRQLEGKPQRCAGQCFRVAGGCPKCKGDGEADGNPCPECGGSGDRLDRTHVEWKAERVILPIIPGSVASGAVICAHGITAGFRGMKVKLPDGTQQRPDQVILDDPQTDDSAASVIQVNKTLSILRKAIVKLGGHRSQLAIVVNATVICVDDAIDKLLHDPSWQGERIPMVRSWPKEHKTLWLEDYARLRTDFDRSDPDDQKRARRDATEFYRQRREAMDQGGDVCWDGCFDPKEELSALQHAYNALIDDGEEAFASEYQIQPLLPREQQVGPTREQLLAKANRIPRLVVPTWATRLTAGVDVQQDVLFWFVTAWAEDFTGHAVEYGAFPDQERAYYTLRDVQKTLADATGAPSVESRIFKGLTMLADQLLARRWERDDGGTAQVERIVVDSGNWRELILQWVRQFNRKEVTASLGRAPGPGMTPLSDWKIRPGERRGLNWIMGKDGISFESSMWKSFVFNRFATAEPSKGCLTLFADPSHKHAMLLDHLTSEKPDRNTSETTGRSVTKWIRLPNRDNHLLDALVLTAVGASVQGVQLAETTAAPAPAAKKATREDYEKKRAAFEAKRGFR